MGNFVCKKEVEVKKVVEVNKDINNEHIKEFVKKLLNNKSTNLTFVPDSMESKLYENVLTALIQDIKEIIDTVKIQLLDYEITMNLHPLNHPIINSSNIVIPITPIINTSNIIIPTTPTNIPNNKTPSNTPKNKEIIEK